MYTWQERRCENCRFSKRLRLVDNDDKELFECRREPPRQLTYVSREKSKPRDPTEFLIWDLSCDTRVEIGWPQVIEDEWCGEFQRND